MKTDANKGIVNIFYNVLNLPQEIDFGSGNKIRYFYTANGIKQKKVVIENNIITKEMSYIGPFIYDENLNKAYVLFDEGRLMDDEGDYTYEYFLKDHLGNTRVSFTKNGSIQKLQEDHYYPFGMTFQGVNSSVLSPENKYKYNGKELQDDDVNGNKLNLYDYGARFYDAALGRWNAVDPLAEEFPSWTQYHYVHNNPIVLVDPTGMSADWYQSEAGNLLWQDKSDKNITVNGEKFNNIGKSVSIGDSEGNYVNYYENVPISISNAPVNSGERVMNSQGLKGQLLSRNSPLSERSQKELFISSIHQGQQDFLEHPVTKATANTLLFVATGGIEGVVSLASGGKTAFNIIKNSRSSDWVRTGKTVVSNQVAVGAGTPGATVTWGAKGGGNLAKTGQNMGFHYHLHKYNWYKPWSWFKQTPIIKPPKP